MVVKITYFVHGTTTDNEQGIATGCNHGELSKLGISQSKELKNLVAHHYFDVLFCSDLKRAIDSAELWFHDTYTIIQDARLRECDYGDMNGTMEKTFKDNMFYYVDTPFPNGESYKDVEKRIADFIKFLRWNYEWKYIAIIAHQAPQLALDVLLKKKTWEQAIAEDWRKTKSRQPWWEYIVE